MGNVVFYMSMSLDGFVTAAGVTPEEGLGRGGERLHDWGSDAGGSELLERIVGGTGAVITGRRTYDLSERAWGPDGPTGAVRLPTFVVTHREAPAPPEGGVYTFVTDGVESAVRQAKAAAGDRECR
jgi:dihydrofolate reductase